MNKHINLILGTMTFGEQVFGEDVKEMIRFFQSCGYNEIDTAYVYNDGECERLIGRALSSVDKAEICIGTKVNPRITGRLDKAAVLSQFEESQKRLKVDRVETLYLHFPDKKTPVKSALEACALLYEEGKFSKLGLSNFPAWLVAEVYHICKSNGWMLPKVYEGLYNPLSRNAERELDEALNHYGLRFYAYNPLAGGMLTNKYSGTDKALKEGRFTHRPNYRNRYWKDSYFKAVDHIKAICADYGISIIEATYRWMAFHSMLNSERGDGIIIGASRIEQLKQNIVTLSEGKLPEDIVTCINDAWEICKVDAPEYFRFYTAKK